MNGMDDGDGDHFSPFGLRFGGNGMRDRDDSTSWHASH
jgi:hypothetical protein